MGTGGGLRDNHTILWLQLLPLLTGDVAWTLRHAWTWATGSRGGRLLELCVWGKFDGKSPHSSDLCPCSRGTARVCWASPLSLTLWAESLSRYRRVNAPRELSEGSVLCRVQQLPWDRFRKTTHQGWEKGRFKAWCFPGLLLHT